jgi:F-type H+-transporting ATPase subunit b
MIFRLLSICTPLLLAAEHVMAATAHGQEAVAHGHGHEGGGDAGLPQFDPTWFASQIFWLVVAFIILYFFFSRKTLPEISGVIENRREHIQGDLDTADRLTREAEEVQNAYEESLEKARVEASGVIADAESSMNLKAARAMESFQERSERDVAATEARIKKAKADVMPEIDKVAAEVAAEAANRIVSGLKFREEDALQIVEKIAKEERVA